MKSQNGNYPGIIGGILAPNLVGPLVDHVNLNTPSRNCLTGADTTPADYKVPFALADFCFLGTMIFANFNQVIVVPVLH